MVDDFARARMPTTHESSQGNMEDSDDESVDPMNDETENHEGDATNDVERLTKPFTIQIKIGRFFVLALMLCLGGGAAIVTYFFLEDDERDDYRRAFFVTANTVEETLSFHSANLVDSLRGFADEITAFANASNVSFPFVTMSTFEVSARNARLQSGVETISMLPFVSDGERQRWERYAQDNQAWIFNSRSISTASEDYIGGQIPQTIYNRAANGELTTSPQREFYAPIWLSSPPPLSPSPINWNLYTDTLFQQQIGAIAESKESLIGNITDDAILVMDGFVGTENHNDFHSQFVNFTMMETADDRPHAVIFTPIFRDLSKSLVAGVLASVLTIDRYMVDLIPSGVEGVVVVVSNTCGGVESYELVGRTATYLGPGDLHTSNDFNKTLPFLIGPSGGMEMERGGICFYKLDIYPSSTFESTYTSSTPVIATVVVLSVFAAMGLAFFMYNLFVERRNAKVVNAAARSTAILSSLFPSTVRDRLFAEKENAAQARQMRGAQSRLKGFLDGEEQEEENEDGEVKSNTQSAFKTKPIADLFPETTVMFGDIVGFTAWSSVREPAQVFTLLETLYAAFDEIAKRRRVFKVETVGDCYVAVTGLPDPRKDHAIAMARFARDCMQRMQMLTKQMEVELGPDTGDLAMRVGLHSGPVTAGVLRGDRARFQLFGDTMNTAARMESNGKPRRIQLSQETADLLMAAGKGEWIRQREDVVVAKGKGALRTYWLIFGADRTETASVASGMSTINSDEKTKIHKELIEDDRAKELASEKINRLINWNVEVLARLLKQIVQQRQARRTGFPDRRASMSFGAAVPKMMEEEPSPEDAGSKTPLEEVVEVVKLPEFNAHTQIAATVEVELDKQIVDELYDFVSKIAAMYHDMPFHNFEHASHVTMSVVKLLSRIVAPELKVETKVSRRKSIANVLYDHTYGITSDPLTQFACVFSALVHDVDHSGVPNSVLVKERVPIAAYYKGKSVAEQNSVDLAWGLLMQEQYSAFRTALCSSDAERKRFRQLVVNSVLATDIMDKDLKALRNARWEKAFTERAALEAARELPSDNRNRKATIVIEHIIQASDIAHTMQHWHIYRKWNERLFVEMAKGYSDGRLEKHPSEFWYNGEIGFFDFYIIPLAKKLKDCGVFGVSSDEYLNYALKNRREWEAKGQEVVSEMVERLSKDNVSKRSREWENRSNHNPKFNMDRTVSVRSFQSNISGFSDSSFPRPPSKSKNPIMNVPTNVSVSATSKLYDNGSAWQPRKTNPHKRSIKIVPSRSSEEEKSEQGSTSSSRYSQSQYSGGRIPEQNPASMPSSSVPSRKPRNRQGSDTQSKAPSVNSNNSSMDGRRKGKSRNGRSSGRSQQGLNLNPKLTHQDRVFAPLSPKSIEGTSIDELASKAYELTKPEKSLLFDEDSVQEIEFSFVDI